MNISAGHRTAAQLRAPVFDRSELPQVKIAALEEFMLVSAHWSGELHEERLDLYAMLEPHKRKWDTMAGWEMLARGKTVEAANAAKRQINPALHDKIADLGWRIRRLTEEIDRLERDATKVSRAYSMLSGS